jgi:hypothetical protein
MAATDFSVNWRQETFREQKLSWNNAQNEGRMILAFLDGGLLRFIRKGRVDGQACLSILERQ